MDNFGFLKVAAAVPHVRVADCDYNTERMAAMAEEAARRGVEIVAFPELGVTAYTCGDLLLQQTLLDAADEALERLVRATRKLPLTLIAGAPLRHGSTLYNCAVVFTQGKVLGVVPKTYIPDYGEFYENRWFASGAGISDEHIAVAGQQADFGADLTFEVNGAEFGIEICEDLWTAAPPSSQLALNGAKVIFNLSASPESVGKHAYLRQLVAQQSGRAIAAYVYCSAGFGESTTDLVFAGNAVIAENGCILREAARFSPDEQLIVADVDIERLEFERRRNTSFRMHEGAAENTVIEMEVPEGLRAAALDRDIDPMPFVPKDEADRSERCEEIFQIQSHGLAKRLAHTRCEKAVIGISGGLDSTLALLVTARTFDFLHLDRAGIIGITMPGFGTTDRTYNNALELMRGLGVTIREIPIRDACTQHFQDIGLDPGSRGVMVVFGGHVIAGTRAKKNKTISYDAFASVNFPALALVQGDRLVRYVASPWPTGPVEFGRALNPKVFLLKLTPGLGPELIPAIFQQYDCVIVESFGVGGIPQRLMDAFAEELGDYDKTHKILILTTQVTYEGSDVGIYEVGKRVKNRFRFLEAHDMTIEAVVTKVMWLLAQNCENFDQLQQRFYRQINFDTFYH